mmetsp:Transcript_14714/g.36756  ORF Transcript_14714/g.36756 Transcript_14714/m.36756 type:complete len:283 (-) Transcript_14714:341-1189(-)
MLFRGRSETASTFVEGARPPLPVLAAPLVKVALVGDSQVGKTSLMVRFVERGFDETQLQTQGVNFMEKTVTLRGRGMSQDVTFSIWDIGGHKDSGSMLPLVCNDASVILLVFDLTRHETLDSIREWHRKARGLNKCAMPLLVGVKYDLLLETPPADHAHVEAMARKFAAAIEAPLIFSSPSVPINVTNIFKVIMIRLFGLKAAVPQITGQGEPLVLYEPISIAAPSFVPASVMQEDRSSDSSKDYMSAHMQHAACTPRNASLSESAAPTDNLSDRDLRTARI